MTAQNQLMEAAIRELSRRHVALLKELGPVRVLAQDPCPRCMGRVIASDAEARCTVCGWNYCPAIHDEPLASRRADP